MARSQIVLCDTDVIINYLHDRHHAVETLDRIGWDNFLLSDITIMELLRGARDKRDLKMIQKKVSSFNALHINDEISKKAVTLIDEFYLSHNLGIPDAIIAASSLHFELTLFTYNIKDYQYLPGIILYR